ncbi:trafficking protein particle complex subunit 8-like [Ylistrum balloti]|uniref:trafficking protein particle complex subunit 8-like n=1 Tax=Ylistrum balloti TaxID=509963 RepID=UPI002905C035|nr:trafficking protein particle complex subunit 8-like [Ylistrum balloti]
MAQCKQTAQEFIQNTFNPHVAVLCSPDAEVLCQKNNLTFVELVQPFCHLTTEAHIRDPNNVPHCIRHLKISMLDMTAQAPQQAIARKMMSDAVANAQPQLVEGGRGNVISIGNYDLQLSASTPWFEAYRDVFLQVLPPSDHEFLNHCVGCVFVVSSGHSDPITGFNNLAGQQYQQQTQFPNKMPRWLAPNLLKYYVLLHDVTEGEDAKADAVYQSMKSTYGASGCHLLHINSRSIKVADSMKTDSNLPDPWSQFLTKPVDISNSKKRQKARYYIAWEGADYDVSIGNGTDDGVAFPGKVSEGTLESSSLNDSLLVESASEALEAASSGSGADSDMFDHPLAMDHSTNSINHVEDRLSPDDSVTMETNHTGNNTKVQTTPDKKVRGHGMCLTTSDHDRLRIFIHEFSVRALIPWAEMSMRFLNEQLTSRKGIPRSIFSVTKKWFGGNKATEKAAATNQNTTVVYSQEAPELQMRRLADLAFLFQMYDFAYQTYHTAKRDFNNDHAWLHTAGALEMASLSVFMQGPVSSQKYPSHYMESAITTYLQSCKNPLYAARATLVSTEALKSKGMYNEAALQFIKLTSEDSDLRSALLLEQAAHCYINMETPKVRKYSFHMILAGHRYSKAAQRKHALRAYSQALQVYKGKNWSLAEDHINFTLGRQSFNLKQLENATAAFKHLLTENSKQIASQQGAFLREYLFVYKQLLSQEAGEYGHNTRPLPELPLPVLDSNSTKVLLGARPQPSQAPDKVATSGVWFDHKESNHPRWQKLEEALVAAAVGGLPNTFRPTLQCYTNRTDNKYSPVGFVGEPIIVEVYLVNPLKVMLVLTEVTLLWSFLPSLPGQDKAQLITNEVSSTSVKNTLANEIIQTQVIDEIIMDANSKLTTQITLTPHQTGELRIVEISYNLGGVLIEGNGPKPNMSNTIFVRGKQKLEVQGPRLNITKEDKANKMYGPDRRLDLVIQQEMPLLQVSFCNFPRTLLCGEVHAVMLQFTNVGSSPLHKLKVASTCPEFFTLGCHGQLPKFPCVYQSAMDVGVSDSECMCNSISKDSVNVTRVVDIDLPSGTLQPKSTISIPAWIRGNDIGGIHEIHFMFYYEPVQQLPNISHRLLRHTAVVNTLESLSVRAIAHRGNNTSSHPNGHRGSCVVMCELENLSQIQSQRAYVKEIQINQVSCASEEWTIQYLNSQHVKSEIQIGSRETMQLCLKAVRSSTNLDTIMGKESIVFSDVPFDTQQICSAMTPCADFFFRSKCSIKPLDPEAEVPVPPSKRKTSEFTDLNCAIQVGFTLVILWKACVVNEDGEVQIRVGQHHVTLEKIDNIFTSYPYVLIPTEQPAVRFVMKDREAEASTPDSEVTTQLVDLNFNHRSEVKHNFSNGRLCQVPVTLLLQNCSKVTLDVLVDTSQTPDRLSSKSNEASMYDHAGEYHHNSSFNWVGQTITQLRLEAEQQAAVQLSACFSKPGIYNLNRVAVFVTYSRDSNKMVLQRHSSPSVVVIGEVS